MRKECLPREYTLMSEHTATPWTCNACPSGIWNLCADNDIATDLGYVDTEADAEFIVRACNVHDELVDACVAALRALDNYDAEAGYLRTALLKAKGTTHLVG